MGSSSEEFGNRVPIALAALIALIFIAALAAIAGWLAIALRQPAPASQFATDAACRICGVVEEVRELERAAAAPQHLNGDQAESIVVLVAALGGGTRLLAVPRTYETAVRFEDGSLRVLRDGFAPSWKRGDRVRVLKGKVEPVI